MAKDEPVDGPAIAARILRKLPPEAQERLIEAMARKAPAVTKKVESNLSDLTELLALSVQSMQVLLQHVESHDIALSLKLASDELKEHLTTNMSQRRAQEIQRTYEALPPVRISQVQRAQQRILEKLDDLRAKGMIGSPVPVKTTIA